MKLYYYKHFFGKKKLSFCVNGSKAIKWNERKILKMFERHAVFISSEWKMEIQIQYSPFFVFLENIILFLLSFAGFMCIFIWENYLDFSFLFLNNKSIYNAPCLSVRYRN